MEIDDCVFGNSVSDSEGGVIFAEDSNFSLSNSDVYGNYARDKGGAISAYNCNVSAWDCNLSGNKCNDTQSSYGGALYFSEVVASIEECIIANNYAYENGGGIRFDVSDIEIFSCRILNNTSGNGAGISSHQSDCIIYNCEIVSNSANDDFGGGIYSESQDLLIYNSSITNNYAKTNGGGIYSNQFNSTVSLYNSIVYDNNTKTSTPNDIDCGVNIGQVLGYNSCVSNHIGTNVVAVLDSCIKINPEFRDVSETSLSGTVEFIRLSREVKGTDTKFKDELQVGDNIYLDADGQSKALCVKEIISDTELVLVSTYLGDAIYPGVAKAQKKHLDLQRKSDGDAKDSPCIDSGDNQFVNSSVDLLGQTRIVDGNSDSQVIVDMGARETEK